jgi:hypothetical protein
MRATHARLAVVTCASHVAPARHRVDTHAARRGDDVHVTVRAHALAAPDTTASGWTRLRVDETGGAHVVVVFRVPATTTAAQLPALLAALDTAAATPKPLVALGGPEIGAPGEVVVRLAAGRYLLGCVLRDEAGHRHAAGGEARLLTVVDRPSGARGAPTPAPVATRDVRMVDFAYVGADRWKAGRHMLRVRNDGPQDHQLRLARLRVGSTISQWMAASDPAAHATDVVGLARLGAGHVAYLPATLPRGDYVAYCLVPDARTRQPHAASGMVRLIHVE